MPPYCTKSRTVFIRACPQPFASLRAGVGPSRAPSLLDAQNAAVLQLPLASLSFGWSLPSCPSRSQRQYPESPATIRPQSRPRPKSAACPYQAPRPGSRWSPGLPLVPRPAPPSVGRPSRATPRSDRSRHLPLVGRAPQTTPNSRCFRYTRHKGRPLLPQQHPSSATPVPPA